MLRLFFLPEEQGNILFCIFQLEQFDLGFLVLLIEPVSYTHLTLPTKA